MSSFQGQHRTMNWRGRPFYRTGNAGRRSSSHSSGFLQALLRAAERIWHGPKELWPYVLPWLGVLLAIVFLGLVVRGVLTRQLLVPPVETPKSLVERGYTSNFLAERIMSAMREISQDAESIPHDALTDYDAQPDIQIPGQDVSYASTVRFIKGIVNRPDVAVHVGIMKMDDGADSYLAHVQIEGGPFDSRERTVRFVGTDLEKFVSDIAIEAMRLAEPNILASHLYSDIQKTRCSLAQCDYGEIVKIYDEVLALPASEQGEWAQAGKAWLLVSQGLSKKAEQQSREALTVYKDSAVLRASLGVALEQQHRIDDALDALQAGAGEKSRTAENLRLLGDVLLHAKHYPEALDAFTKANRMAPGSVNNLHDWAEALVAVGRYDEAIDKLSRAVALRPDLAPSYVEWGQALELKGDPLGAGYKYAQALELDPDTLSARENHMARLSKAFRGADSPDTPSPDAKARPVSNPPAASGLQAAQIDARWVATPTA
ncbi:tetratricopeptide repeat protein [Paraburkholderia lacunae]|uniref:Uncharacterized protein n=1 Tax=Paraburkholderia lacunae TaxID=2211104 RepID=A0A370NB47_9BURK|nr:tetratricopeptide repeat protein [Paraburkholderia lacunae]RDK02822.1 hypothetical protein DLM46_11290 [Paraburkholderia lacunae]